MPPPQWKSASVSLEELKRYVAELESRGHNVAQVFRELDEARQRPCPPHAALYSSHDAAERRAGPTGGSPFSWLLTVPPDVPAAQGFSPVLDAGRAGNHVVCVCDAPVPSCSELCLCLWSAQGRGAVSPELGWFLLPLPAVHCLMLRELSWQQIWPAAGYPALWLVNSNTCILPDATTGVSASSGTAFQLILPAALISAGRAPALHQLHAVLRNPQAAADLQAPARPMDKNQRARTGTQLSPPLAIRVLTSSLR